MRQRRASTPDTRAAAGRAEVRRVRRSYKVDLTTRKKLLPAEIPHVEDTVVVLKLAGYTHTQMAKVIGLSRGQVGEILKKPEISERMAELRAALPQAALDLLQGYMIEAVQAIVDVMRKTPDDKLILQAAGDILDRSGLSKASRQERHNITEEKMTITDDGILEKLRQASPEIQEQAAQMIEGLEGLLLKAGNEGISSEDEVAEDDPAD